jgi:hypothetical protein
MLIYTSTHRRHVLSEYLSETSINFTWVSVLIRSGTLQMVLAPVVIHRTDLRSITTEQLPKVRRYCRSRMIGVAELQSLAMLSSVNLNEGVSRM